MVPKICSIDDCSAGSITRGWCAKHYTRWRRHGDTAASSRIDDPKERFWSKVDKTATCWNWMASRNAQGYGQLQFNGKGRKAHTVALEMELGYPRPEGFDTCHTCDNPSCVRPSHLYFGTRQQNVDDAWERGRFQVGEDRPSAKVAEVDVVAIRHEYAAGAEVDDLCAAYGLKNSTIRCIVLGFKWKHAGGPITVRRGRNKKKAA